MGNGSPRLYKGSPCVRFWYLSFADRSLEEQYKTQRQSRIPRAHQILEYVLGISAVVFLALGPVAPASLVFRANNIFSWAWCAAARKLFQRYPRLWRHWDAIGLAWGLHYVTYQSLTLMRSRRFLFGFGLADSSIIKEATLKDMGDEAYQLLFNCLAIVAMTMHGCLSLAYTFVLVVSAPCIYMLQVLTLGTCLDTVDVVKHVIAFSMLCCLAFLGARQIELDQRHIFLHERELKEELAREREWHRCFGRILASNFDYSTTLDRDLTLAEDMRLSTWLGTMVHARLHIYDLAKGDGDKKRMQEFFDTLCDQVLAAQDTCHGPEMLSFGLSTEASVDVDMQVLWVPGCLHAAPEHDGAQHPPLDKVWPAGNLWVCFRQRQLEELRRTTQQKHQHSGASTDDALNDGALESWPDFTLVFEAGSPRFTILECSAGSPLEHAMAQAPDLLDWLPLRYSERFTAWVEEQIRDAPPDESSFSASFGTFNLEPPCSDWHALRVQRALLQIPEYDMDEGRDLPVTLRLMGVHKRNGPTWRTTTQTPRSRMKGLSRRMRQAAPGRVNSEAILEGALEEEFLPSSSGSSEPSDGDATSVRDSDSLDSAPMVRFRPRDHDGVELEM